MLGRCRRSLPLVPGPVLVRGKDLVLPFAAQPSGIALPEDHGSPAPFRCNARTIDTMAADLKAGLVALAKNFYYRRYFEWKLPARRFVQVNIETNSVCTRRCHFCLFGIKDEVPVTRMSAEVFFRIIDELSAMRFAGRISLFSLNEPLTDKRIYDFVRYAALMLPNACHVLVSNGDILTQERMDRLFSCGLDWLMVNSYDAESLIRIQPLLEYAASAHPGKVEHIDRTVFTDWVGRAGNIPQYAGKPVAGFCDLPNYALYIKPDGKVLSCCHDLEARNVMGDVSTQSVLQAWFGPRFSALRSALNRGDRSVSDLCKACDYKPDPEYFHFNQRISRVRGKMKGWSPQPPSPGAITQSQEIRERLIAREARPRRDQRTIPIHDAGK